MAAISDPLVQELLNGRFVACLGTQNEDGSVHQTAVWYVFEHEALYIATSSRSRKARNAKARPTASLMIDSREPQASRGVCCSGKVEILTGDVSRQVNGRIHQRYLSAGALSDPRVGPVFAAWDDVTLKMVALSLFAWDMREADRLAFGGAMSTPGYLLPLDR